MARKYKKFRSKRKSYKKKRSFKSKFRKSNKRFKNKVKKILKNELETKFVSSGYTTAEDFYWKPFINTVNNW